MISILEIKRSWDRLIFIIGILVGKTVFLYWEDSLPPFVLKLHMKTLASSLCNFILVFYLVITLTINQSLQFVSPEFAVARRFLENTTRDWHSTCSIRKCIWQNLIKKIIRCNDIRHNVNGAWQWHQWIYPNTNCTCSRYLQALISYDVLLEKKLISSFSNAINDCCSLYKWSMRHIFTFMYFRCF